MNQNQHHYAAGMLVVGCILFGLGSIIVKFVPIGGYAIAFWRLLIASGIFWGLMKLKYQHFPKSRKALLYGCLSGIFLAFDLAFWHESIYAVGPGISTLLNSLQIFFLAVIGFIFFSERQSKLQLFSLVLAMVGVALIAGEELQHNIEGIYGIVIGVISAVMLAASMVMVKKVHQEEEVALFPLMLIISFSGAIVLIIPSLIFNADKLYPTHFQDWGLIVIYGAIMQCVAWGMIAYAIPLLSLGLTGLLLLSEPVAALVIDYFYLHKAINLWQWIGAVLTLFAIYLGSVKH
ncbi:MULTISPECIES: DMT family transporter [unclassified Pasteurella]|uniref:DMT family transporter n=1 Tax=unclassified Pasteurella TaxID=2621516 RepID=UPI0010743D93|nr:DMT family transporter [Pasteurella sp. 19428wF3_WM03]TFU52533.1 DMT family transporter [Pasteurella sp. WM03]